MASVGGRPDGLSEGIQTVVETAGVQMVEVDGVLYRPEDVPTKVRKAVVEEDSKVETKVRTPSEARRK